MNQLEDVSFGFTRQSFRRATIMEFWLTIVFGASEIELQAARAATYYYSTGVDVVLARTIDSGIVAGVVRVTVLKEKIE